MKIYSYLMCGKPILATAIASHTQVLTPQVAMLVPCEVEAMAGGLRALARDRGLRDALAAAAGRLAAEKYSLKAFEASVTSFCEAVAVALRKRS